MKVLVIPEDPTLDQHILKPIVDQIFRELKRKARVEVLQDPHLRGVEQALNCEILGGILRDNRMIDLFLLIVDRDCDDSHNARLEQCEKHAADHQRVLLGCLAIEEVEIWALALHRKSIKGDWKKRIRVECHPKEVYFDPFVKEMGWATALGWGRAPAMRNLPQNWQSLKKLCPEIADLTTRIRNHLNNLRPAP